VDDTERRSLESSWIFCSRDITPMVDCLPVPLLRAPFRRHVTTAERARPIHATPNLSSNNVSTTSSTQKHHDGTLLINAELHFMTHGYYVHPLQTPAGEKYREVVPDDWTTASFVEA
jgi:hypothetical protein